MRDRSLRKAGGFYGRRILSVVVRAAVLLSMSFGIGFGVLAAMRSPVGAYDPHAFALGLAALFGAACGAIGLLFSRTRKLKHDLLELQVSAEELADRNWELKESEDRRRHPHPRPEDCR
jgi:hypothetical protein